MSREPRAVPVAVLSGWDLDALEELTANVRACAGRHRVVDVSDLEHPQPEAGVERLLVATQEPARAAERVLARQPDRTIALDALVTVVDGSRAAVRLATDSPFSPSAAGFAQIALADCVVVTRTAELSDRGLDHVLWQIRGLNRFARIERLADPTVGGCVLDVEAHTARAVRHRVLSVAPTLISECTAVPRTVCVGVEGRFDPDLLDGWLEWLGDEHEAELFRWEGVFPLADGDWTCTVAGIGASSSRTLNEMPTPLGRALLVGRNLDAEVLEDSLRGALAE
ncbi:MAG: hypothetical protein FJW88_12170 [Actinobacteria bacterium]|nr:hypothetical protein [Actinomycetota bacterium]